MPCHDEQDDRGEYSLKIKNALTAMLCGVMRMDQTMVGAAQEWFQLHEQIDHRRRGVRWDWQDARIGELQLRADEVLLGAYSRTLTR